MPSVKRKFGKSQQKKTGVFGGTGTVMYGRQELPISGTFHLKNAGLTLLQDHKVRFIPASEPSFLEEFDPLGGLVKKVRMFGGKVTKK